VATRPRVTCAADAVRFTICGEYETWLREERGLVRPSIVALLWEARHFLAWQLGRCGAESLTDLNVGDIDLYMDLRAPNLTRKSLKDVAELLHLTRMELCDLACQITSSLPELESGSIERHNALLSLTNIRRVMALRKSRPGPG
jgi:integrase/recombinase XerD